MSTQRRRNAAHCLASYVNRPLVYPLCTRISLQGGYVICMHMFMELKCYCFLLKNTNQWYNNIVWHTCWKLSILDLSTCTCGDQLKFSKDDPSTGKCCTRFLQNRAELLSTESNFWATVIIFPRLNCFLTVHMKSVNCLSYRVPLAITDTQLMVSVYGM